MWISLLPTYMHTHYLPLKRTIINCSCEWKLKSNHAFITATVNTHITAWEFKAKAAKDTECIEHNTGPKCPTEEFTTATKYYTHIQDDSQQILECHICHFH